MINLSNFSTDDRPREYCARFSVHGEIVMTIIADDLDAAKAKAQAMIEDGSLVLEGDDIEEADLETVYETRPMYRVWDEGRKAQVSHVQDHHTPREPDERGF